MEIFKGEGRQVKRTSNIRFLRKFCKQSLMLERAAPRSIKRNAAFAGSFAKQVIRSEEIPPVLQ
jgi:hypothetical protein